MTGIRRPFVVAALAATVLTGGCGRGTSTESLPTEQPAGASAESSPGSLAASASGAARTPGSLPFTLPTHCGVENLRVDGRWWHAAPPLYNRAGSGPPAGWGDPVQKGRLTIESPDRAVFEALGQRVVFVPAPDNEPVRMCD